MNATGTSDVACPVLAEVNLSKEMLAGNYCCYPHVAQDCYVSIAFNLTQLSHLGGKFEKIKNIFVVHSLLQGIIR